MNIGLIAHDGKKKLMQNFCIAYRGILNKHELFATATTGRLIEEVTNLTIHKYLAGPLGGEQQMASQIEHNLIDMVIFLRDPQNQQLHEPDIFNVMHLCDVHNIPLATNLATTTAQFASTPESAIICAVSCTWHSISGTLLAGNIKSSIGLGLILSQGIGDTIRVSLTGDPVEEIKSAKLILKTLGLRKGGIEVVSCPTCGRTKIDLIGLANKVETMVAEYPLDIKVAVMGCVVNGPGEAREADLGIAGGIGEGLLIKKGEIIRKVKEDELLDALRNELEHWGE